MAQNYSTVNRTGLFTQTTDGDFHIIGTQATLNDKCYTIDVAVLAMRTNGDEAAGYRRSATFRNDTGVVTQVGSTTSIATHEDDATWDVDFSIVGTTVNVRVKGNPGKIINWRADIDIIQVVGLEAEQT